MTTYTDALQRGDTQGQHRAAERAKREMTKALLEFARKGRKAAIKRALGMA